MRIEIRTARFSSAKTNGRRETSSRKRTERGTYSSVRFALAFFFPISRPVEPDATRARSRLHLRPCGNAYTSGNTAIQAVIKITRKDPGIYSPPLIAEFLIRREFFITVARFTTTSFSGPFSNETIPSLPFSRESCALAHGVTSLTNNTERSNDKRSCTIARTKQTSDKGEMSRIKQVNSLGIFA